MFHHTNKQLIESAARSIIYGADYNIVQGILIKEIQNRGKSTSVFGIQSIKCSLRKAVFEYDENYIVPGMKVKKYKNMTKKKINSVRLPIDKIFENKVSDRSELLENIPNLVSPINAMQDRPRNAMQDRPSKNTSSSNNTTLYQMLSFMKNQKVDTIPIINPGSINIDNSKKVSDKNNKSTISSYIKKYIKNSYNKNSIKIKKDKFRKLVFIKKSQTPTYHKEYDMHSVDNAVLDAALIVANSINLEFKEKNSININNQISEFTGQVEYKDSNQNSNSLYIDNVEVSPVNQKIDIQTNYLDAMTSSTCNIIQSLVLPICYKANCPFKFNYDKDMCWCWYM